MTMSLTQRGSLVSLLVIGILIAGSSWAASPGQPWAVIRNGSDSEQIAWSVCNGGLVPGAFQGPMAFACDVTGRLWIADSLNARLVVFSAKGRFEKTIDLLPLQKVAELTQPPLICDLALIGAGELVLADDANTTLLVIDFEGRFQRRVGGPGNRPGTFFQINRVYADNEGRLLVEEVGRNRISVFSPSGEYLNDLEGLGGVACHPDGRVLQPVFDGNPRERALEWYDLQGKRLGELVRLVEQEDIRFIQPLGFDTAGNLLMWWDTARERVFRSFTLEGKTVAEGRFPLFDPGLELSRPWWPAPDGSIFWVEFTPRQATIRRLTLK